MSSLPTKSELREIVTDSLTNAFLPGKALQDSFIKTDFNQKYDIYSYNPTEALFSPLDFLPFGVITKVGKGAAAIRRGRQLIGMGFGGFGRKKVKEGAVKILTAVGGKLVSSYRPPVYRSSKQKQESRVDSSLTSKSKTRGTKRSTKKFLSGTTPYAYRPKRGERCRKGYKSEDIMGRRMCVKID